MPKKSTKLKAIQEDVQRVAEAISCSLGLEAEIVDEELRIFQMKMPVLNLNVFTLNLIHKINLDKALYRCRKNPQN